MQFRVLGTLEAVAHDGTQIDLGGARPRAVFAMLLVASGRVVPAEVIVERLWSDNPPATASSTLQSYVSRLRRTLDTHRGSGEESATLTWESPGYRLRPAAADWVDFERFEAAAEAGRELLARNDARGARATLNDALALWRGPALLEFADQPWARGIATRLDERRLAALEDRIRADLLLGQHEVVIGELSDLVDQHPLREGFWEHLAVALYRSGRQAEALRAIDGLRRQLVDNLGVDPSPRIRDLEARILGHDPTLGAPHGEPMAETNTPEPAGAVPPAPVVYQFIKGQIPRHFSGVTSGNLVGRIPERKALTGALDGAAQNRTQWVLLEGEPGIGKTRLLEFLAEEAAGRGFHVLWGRSYESGASPAFWPWLGVLRGLADTADGLPEPTRQVIERLTAPAGENDEAAPVDAGRYRLFEAIALLIEVASRRSPLMIALDDLQWADPASLELIEFLTGHIIGSPVLVAATVRELEIGRNDAVVQALANVSRRPLARRILLRGVDRAESAELVRQAIGDDASATVVEAIHRRSEGNPFFIGELSRLLADEAGLTEAELVRRAGVPAGVRDVVHRRLVRLPAATSELVQIAAVIGRETSLGLLSQVSGVAIDRCIDDLEPALVNRLLVEVPGSTSALRFSHALVREVVLDDMSVLRRSRLHLRTADALEAGRRQIDDDAEIVAEHLWQAVSLGIEARVAGALERAAEVALRRFAYETADGLLERALRLRRDLPPGQADPNAELDTLNRLTIVRRVRFGFEQARLNTPIERGKELARRTGRDLVLMELLYTEWAGAATACDFATSVRLAREMLEITERSDDPIIRSTGRSSWAIQCWHLGRIAEAADSMDEALDEIDNFEELVAGAAGPIGGLVENHLLARGFHAVFQELAGRPPAGGSPLPDLARRQTDPYVRLVLYVCEAVRALVGGDWVAAETATHGALQIEMGGDFEFFRAGAICLSGCVQVELGHPAEGVQTIDRGMAMYEQVGVLTVLSFYLAFAADGYRMLGDLAVAEQRVSRAMEVIRSTGELWEEPFVLAATARLRHAQGASIDIVTDTFRSAYDLAREQGAGGTARRVVESAARLGIVLE